RKAFLLVGSAKPTKVSSLSSFYPALRSRQRFGEIQRIASDGTTMLANSPALVGEMADLLRIKAQFVPTNSLSASEMIPLQVRPVNPIWRLMFCGRVVRDKGIFELVQAAGQIVGTGQPCELDIVGPVDEPLKAEIDELAKRLSLADRLHWHGRI